jgi:uncharacterized delta-60 repeat protein
MVTTIDSFIGDGMVTTDLGLDDGGRSVAVQPDGKILVTGYTSDGFHVFQTGLVRYNANGSLDTTFGSGGMVVSFDGGSSVAVQSDGKILVAGDSTGYGFTLVRYDANGSLDTTFGSDGKVTTGFSDTEYSKAEQVAVQSDGKILVAG